MKYTLIGCGRISTNHIKASLNTSLEISAICDIVPSRMEALLNQFSFADKSKIKCFCDYKQLLDEVRPDLVAIATESGNHAKIALDCIEAGCNVIIEKPIALSLADADKIIEAGVRKGVRVCTSHQNRFNIAVQHIRRAIEAERFGRLSHGSIHVRWNRGLEYYQQALWRGTWEQDGGALMNQCIHGIDLLQWMMGGASEVFAYTKKQFHSYIQCEDLGMAVVKFRNGAIGTIEGTTNIFPKNLEETLYLFGETGTIKAGGKSVNTLELWEFGDTGPEDAALQSGLHESTSNVYGNGHNLLYEDMIHAVQNNREPYITARDGRDALELVLAIYLSAAEGKPVQLPLSNCSTLDFIGRFD